MFTEVDTLDALASKLANLGLRAIQHSFIDACHTAEKVLRPRLCGSKLCWYMTATPIAVLPAPQWTIPGNSIC